MKKLIVIATDHYVRNLVEAGAFSEIDDDQTWYVASDGGLRHAEARATLEALPNFVGYVDDPRASAVYGYWILRQLLLVTLRRRSSTIASKVDLLPKTRRRLLRLAALPGVRWLLTRLIFRRTGLNGDLHRLVQRIAPELIIAPSGGYDTLVWDAMRSARATGARSLLLIHNWDNLSSKGAFAVRPDYLGVWGEQSVEQAERIHAIPRDRVAILGVPSFDHYFRHRSGSTTRPFPFRYALFAGCYAPFDERDALERLEQSIADSGLDLKIVYRPHPHRRPRRESDFVDESRFRHVVVDPQVRDLYLASFEEYADRSKRPKPLLPPLSYYPALFEHTELVICPLSTMIVEAAIFERPVLVIAYDDGIHSISPAVVVGYDHFEGIDGIDGFEVCRDADRLGPAAVRQVAEGRAPGSPLREQIRWWLHHDERTYAQRLADLLVRIDANQPLGGVPPGVSTPRGEGADARLPLAEVRAEAEGR
jgi:hypothetical protein